jgi:lysophospholipase L1-like esterase
MENNQSSDPAMIASVAATVVKSDRKRFSRRYWLGASALIVLSAIEIGLRSVYGLGHPVLSQKDDYTGYRFQPNQNLVRFGKRVIYNQYSQRSAAITPNKPDHTLRILMVGDSVLNGGNPTDQSQIMTEYLKPKLQQGDRQVEVLNASAGSWGIGNHLGYIKEFGTFQSDAVIFQIGTHDLIQATSTSGKVGIDPNYPDRPFALAIQEAVVRYLWPKLAEALHLGVAATADIQPLRDVSDRQFEQNMQSLKTSVNLIRQAKIPVYVLFTPNRADVVPTATVPPYQAQFLEVLKQLQVPVVDSYGAWSKQPTTTVESYFRDKVHLSESGNGAIADLVWQKLCVEKQLSSCAVNQIAQ